MSKGQKEPPEVLENDILIQTDKMVTAKQSDNVAVDKQQ